MIKNKKAIYKSKTLWFNFIVLTVSVLELYLNTFLPDNPALSAKIIAGFSIVNIYLRFFTNQPISVTDKEKVEE